MFHHLNFLGFIRSPINSRDIREMINFVKFILVLSLFWMKGFIFGQLTNLQKISGGFIL